MGKTSVSRAAIAFLMCAAAVVIAGCNGGGGSGEESIAAEQVAKFLASDAQANDWFGVTVSVCGDYAIVGAPYEDGGPGNPRTASGAVYIFHRTGTDTWDTGTKIVAPDAQAEDIFGLSVSISGDYAIVGAYQEDGGAGDTLPDAGAAYIFRRTGTNIWDTGTKIVASDAQAGDQFGRSVSISGDYAIVGASEEDGGAGDTLPDAGAAYIFRRTGTNIWDTGTKIVASDAQAGDQFGRSVSISGDYAVAGAYNESGGTGNPIPFAGASYIYRRTGTNTWDTGTKIVAPDAGTADFFGFSVSISGDYAIVGADSEDGGSGDPINNAGAAYIFHRTGTNNWDVGIKIVAPNPMASDFFGLSVSISGDNAIVGAPSEDGGIGDPIMNAGTAFIFHRTGANTWDAVTKIDASDAQELDNFGIDVAIGDDFAIVGAYEEDGGTGDPFPNSGAAYLFDWRLER